MPDETESNDVSGADRLLRYLDFAGILTCNVNPYLPSLSDIGCGWRDATALIDRHELFYCKAFRGRTTYLSKRVYSLLSSCLTAAPMGERPAVIYGLLAGGAKETEELKALALMPQKEFARAFDFLLENLYVTAYKNGKILNQNWSTLVYSTAEEWEKSAGALPAVPCAGDELRAILLRTMPENEFELMMKKFRIEVKRS